MIHKPVSYRRAPWRLIKDPGLCSTHLLHSPPPLDQGVRLNIKPWRTQIGPGARTIILLLYDPVLRSAIVEHRHSHTK